MDGLTTGIPAFAVGGGFAVIVAGFLVKMMADMLKRQAEVISNHVAHSTETTVLMREAIQELTVAVKELKDEQRRSKEHGAGTSRT